MVKKSLHPSVEQFKNFVKKHPELIKEVRTGKKTWQEVYEEWYLLGEDDPKWAKYTKTGKPTAIKEETKSNNESKNAVFNQLITYLKNMDVNQLQHYLGQMSEAIDSVQQLLGQIRDTNQNRTEPEGNGEQWRRRHPFSFRKD
ncbi:YlbD family protein [Caldifermentibacillus hisashii]|uniref:YlbD family protein n=1 Tax=Caldifermentibacillus hisashii TaxID=996558 RepID=UPI002E1B89A1|nr:YlbD family protein [Caldifermentibacillus hisashii]